MFVSSSQYPSPTSEWSMYMGHTMPVFQFKYVEAKKYEKELIFRFTGTVGLFCFMAKASLSMAVFAICLFKTTISAVKLTNWIVIVLVAHQVTLPLDVTCKICTVFGGSMNQCLLFLHPSSFSYWCPKSHTVH